MFNDDQANPGGRPLIPVDLSPQTKAKTMRTHTGYANPLENMRVPVQAKLVISVANALGESWTYYLSLAVVLEVSVLAIPG